MCTRDQSEVPPRVAGLFGLRGYPDRSCSHLERINFHQARNSAGRECAVSTISPHRKHSWIPPAKLTRWISRCGHHQRAACRIVCVARESAAEGILEVCGSGLIVSGQVPVVVDIQRRGYGEDSASASKSTIQRQPVAAAAAISPPRPPSRGVVRHCLTALRGRSRSVALPTLASAR